MSKYFEQGKEIDLQTYLQSILQSDETVDVESHIFDMQKFPKNEIDSAFRSFALTKSSDLLDFFKLLDEREILLDTIQSYTNKKAEIEQMMNNNPEAIKLEEELIEVVHLQKRKVQIETELAGFGDISLDKQVFTKAEEIKKTRISKNMGIMSQIRSFFGEKQDPEIKDTSESSSSIFRRIFTNPILPIAVLHSLSIIYFYIRLNEPSVLTFGFITLVFNIFFLIIFSFTNIPENNMSQLGAEPNLQKVNIPQNSDKKEDMFLVNVAWVDALNAELERISKTIKTYLGGKSYEELQAELIEIKKQKEDAINQEKENMISKEQYMSARRSLDLMDLQIQEFEEKVERTAILILNPSLDQYSFPIFNYVLGSKLFTIITS